MLFYFLKLNPVESFVIYFFNLDSEGLFEGEVKTVLVLAWSW